MPLCIPINGSEDEASLASKDRTLRGILSQYSHQIFESLYGCSRWCQIAGDLDMWLDDLGTLEG